MSRYFLLVMMMLWGLFGVGTSLKAGPVDVSSSTDEAVIDLIDFKEMETADVLKIISQKTGRNIVAGNSVSGKVTLYLKNVGIHEVLRIICEANGLAYIDDNELIRVMTEAEYEKNYGRKFNSRLNRKIVKLNYTNVLTVLPILDRLKSASGVVISDDRSNTLVLTDLTDVLADMEKVIAEIDVPRITRVIDINYARAEELTEKVTPMLTPNVGNLSFDKRSNKLSVNDIPSKIAEIESVIAAFDVMDKQVAIEAKIIQVILNDQFNMGIDWQAVVNKYHRLSLLGNFDVLGANEKRGALSIGTLANDSYEVMIEALQEFGTTNNLSNPHILAVNNQEAKILVGSTEPYVTTTTTTPASGPTTVAEAVNFIEVGVKLYVTPTIHQDGFVTMKIKPEVSSVTRTITTGNNNTIPVVETSEAETTVVVKDGTTIVIGGLIKDENLGTDKKIPVLGDVPVMGTLFRSKDTQKRKTELVIFLSPKIVAGDSFYQPKEVENSDRIKEFTNDYIKQKKISSSSDQPLPLDVEKQFVPSPEDLIPRDKPRE